MKKEYLIDWDYEVTCPECGEVFLLEYDPDYGSNTETCTCDECGHSFVVHADLNYSIDVSVEEVQK